MDFTFAPEEEAFRQEVRSFLKQELPPDWSGMDTFAATDDDHALGREFDRKLARKGWLTMAWPKEYGGQGRPYREQLIFNEEKGYFLAPTGGMHGVSMVGPTVMVYGTQEQKKRYLGAIARAEVVWCQGFSEPGAGSDLASLQTRAAREGDFYILNGQKLWTTNGHHADWMFLLARTDPDAPKHRGISYLLLDLRTPGVSIRPVWLMSGGRVNEFFFDNVRLPVENLAGEENQGWYVAMTTLSFERSGARGVGETKRNLDDMAALAQEPGPYGSPLARDPLVRHRLAEMAVEVEIGRMLSYRVNWLQGRGDIPQYEASQVKTYVTELEQRLAQTGMAMLGLYGALQEGSPWVVLKGRIEHAYRATIGETILAGTSEIQRNIIAQRGLGLPRSY